MNPVLSGHSKIDKTKVLKPCGSLMQVKSIEDTFGLFFSSSLSGHLKTGFTVCYIVVSVILSIFFP